MIEDVKLAEKLGISLGAIRRAFLDWCERVNVSYRRFRVVKKNCGEKKWCIAYMLPQEFLKEYLARHYATKKKIIYTSSRLAKELGVSNKVVVRTFKWWCIEKGRDYRRYKVGKLILLPPEFVREARELIEKRLGRYKYFLADKGSKTSGVVESEGNA